MTGERTRNPVRKQKADFVRAGQSDNQYGSDDTRYVVQYGGPGFAILPTCSYSYSDVNRNNWSRFKDS